MGAFADNIRRKAAEKEAAKRWQPFRQLDLAQYKDKNPPPGLVAAYMNNLYSVQVFKRKTDIGDILIAGLRAHLQEASRKMTWATKQRIKNEVFGTDRSAVEVYPPEKELVDEADMYWLWIMPKGQKLPFNLRTAQTTGAQTFLRSVMDAEMIEVQKQVVEEQQRKKGRQ